MPQFSKSLKKSKTLLQIFDECYTYFIPFIVRPYFEEQQHFPEKNFSSRNPFLIENTNKQGIPRKQKCF